MSERSASAQPKPLGPLDLAEAHIRSAREFWVASEDLDMALQYIAEARRESAKDTDLRPVAGPVGAQVPVEGATPSGPTNLGEGTADVLPTTPAKMAGAWLERLGLSCTDAKTGAPSGAMVSLAALIGNAQRVARQEEREACAVAVEGECPWAATRIRERRTTSAVPGDGKQR